MNVCSGIVFWILVGLALASVPVFLARFLDLRRARIDWQDFLKGIINNLDAGNAEEALAICDDTGVPVANIVAAAIRNRSTDERHLREAVDAQGRAEISRLDRRLASLAIIAQVAPCVGLLGTVLGFIQVVQLVNAGDLVVRAEFQTVSMRALLSAALGLFVAILVSVMYGTLRVRLERTVVELETAASQIVGYFSTPRETAA